MNPIPEAVEEALAILFYKKENIEAGLKQIDLENENAWRDFKDDLQKMLLAMPNNNSLRPEIKQEAYSYTERCVSLHRPIPEESVMEELKRKIMKLQNPTNTQRNIPTIHEYYEDARKFIEDRQRVHRLRCLDIEKMEIKPHFGRFLVSCPNMCDRWISIDDFDDPQDNSTQKFVSDDLERHVFVDCVKLKVQPKVQPKHPLQKTKSTQTTPSFVTFRPIRDRKEIMSISSDEDKPRASTSKSSSEDENARQNFNTVNDTEDDESEEEEESSNDESEEEEEEESCNKCARLLAKIHTLEKEVIKNKKNDRFQDAKLVKKRLKALQSWSNEGFDSIGNAPKHLLTGIKGVKIECDPENKKFFFTCPYDKLKVIINNPNMFARHPGRVARHVKTHDHIDAVKKAADAEKQPPKRITRKTNKKKD